METKVNYAMVGLFVIILGLMIIVIPLWLSSGITNKVYHTYAVYMNESVAGLSVGLAVKYNGVDVGSVKSIELNLQNPQQVDILLNIQEGTPITIATRATVMIQGLTGVGYVSLSGGYPNALPLVAAANQPYPVIKSKPSFFLRLDSVATKLADNIDKLSNSLNQLLNPANQKSVADTLANLDKITTTFANNSAKLNSSLQSADIALKNTALASQQFPIVIQNIHTSTEQLNQLIQQWGYLSQTINGTTLPKINSVVDNLQTFTKNVKQHPSILLRGQAPSAPGPGE